MLELRGISKSYGTVKAVKQVDLTIARGEFFCLLGPSGCGKTTILRMIAGFEQATAGTILLDAIDITKEPPNRRDVNTVFQNYALFPNYNVYDNISYGLKIKKMDREEMAERMAGGDSAGRTFGIREAYAVEPFGRPAAEGRPGQGAGEPPAGVAAR